MALVDVLIIGGGPSGLAAALGLSRARHTCIVFDSGLYRNAASPRMHTVPTWDHENPIEYQKKARAELTNRYSTTKFVIQKVSSVRQAEDGSFIASDAEGTEYHGRKLVLASGVKDVYPQIEGYEECWVSGIFHCLFCHGYEETGSESAGLLAVEDLGQSPPHANAMARNALQFASHVVIYTHGVAAFAESIKPLIANREGRISVDARPIARLEKLPQAARVKVHFEDGSSAVHGFMVHKPRNVIDMDYAQPLALESTPSKGEIKAQPPFNETAVKGCFVVGDLASPAKVVSMGISGAILTSAGIVMQLQAV